MQTPLTMLPTIGALATLLVLSLWLFRKTWRRRTSAERWRAQASSHP